MKLKNEKDKCKRNKTMKNLKCERKIWKCKLVIGKWKKIQDNI